MASWFTRALDRITPWDRGGEVERRRKREEEERQRQANNWQRSNTAPGGLRVTTAQPTQNIVVDKPKTQRPNNLFQDLNSALTIGQKPKSALDIIKENNENAQKAEEPKLRVEYQEPKVDLRLPDGRRASEIPDTPERIIDRGLDAGKSWEQIAKENNYKLEGVREYSQATRPNYGIKIEKPKQSIGNRFRDIFDANTEADKWRRQEGNRIKGEEKDIVLKDPGNIVSRTPIVGHVTKMVNTAGVQIPQIGLTAQQGFATKELTTAQKALDEAKATGDPVLIGAAERRWNLAQKRLRDIQKDLDFVESKFAKNRGGWFNAGTLYDEEASKRGDIETAIKDIALPTAVTALDLYTLGKGSTVSEALKQSGRAGLRSQAGNIAKMTAGNYLSGDLAARSEGATGWDPIKSGSINAVLGSAPDIALPLIGRSFRNRVLPQIMRGRGVNPADVVEELDDAAIGASAEAANKALTPRPIRVATDIPVRIDPSDIVEVPVVRRPSGRPLIKEFEQDFQFPKFEELQQIRVDKATDAANAANAASQPSQRAIDSFEGITPRRNEPFKLAEDTVIKTQDEAIDAYAGWLRDMGEGNGVDMVPDGSGGYIRVSNNVRFGDTKGKRMTKAMWRDEAERQLKAGQADPAIQQVFDDAADPEVQSLLAKGDQTEEAPVGRPIQVKEAKGIPVRDETVVPTDLPETPGQVRVTEATAPMAAKTEAAANAPVVANPPARLPAEVQEVLDNPSKFSKRQVAAARNQRKLARQLAKTQEDTVKAMERIEASNPKRVAGQPEGYAPTGEFARGKKGNAYEKASRATEAAAGEAEMATRSVDDLIAEIGGKESFTPGDRRRIQAALENVAKSNPDDTETRMILKKLQSKSRTELAQGLAMWPRVVRRSASADTLTNRWESKIARALENPGKMTDADFAEVQRANDAFTLARDTAERLDEQFKRTGSEADYKAWEDAYKAARKADEDARFTEVAVAKRVLKGEKGAAVNETIDALKKESGVNTMDLVTANMLSGTATGFRNTFGTEIAGIENRLFANTRAKITNTLFDENVGGYSRKGAREGRKIGMVKLGRDAARRAEIGGKNPLEWAKNWATTINSGGESSLQSQVYSRLGKYYQRMFKEQGLSGKELDMRMRHAMLTDPDGMGEIYLDSAMKSSGLTGLFEKGQTIEKAVTDYVGRHTDSKLGQGASKLIMRLAVGFPTATGNFMYQSAKRLTLGLPSYLEMGMKLTKGDKMAAAQAFDRALKESGSGAAVLGLGAALGEAGMISGSYPDDPDERARWEREGISENSIKIGGAWFPIPQGAGMLGLPLLTGAAIGRDGEEGLKEMYSPKNLSKLLPTDQIQGFLNMASGDGAPQDFKNFVASGVRAVTPVGALLNQIAKSTDATKNDTTTKSLGANIVDQILGGVPGVNNAMNIPDKTDDAGNPIQNPNPLQLALGATSATQGGGVERSAEIQAQINDAVKKIDQYGLLNDPNMEGVLEGTALEALTKLNSGKQLDESDIKALKEGLVKGVSQEGTDTAYLERGEYDTNLAVLKLKRDLMMEDKTVKPSSLEDINLAIKRGEVYKDNEIPYDMISDYKSVGVEEWRKMGDPESDEYDPEMYQMLWDIDQLMTNAGVSYRKGKLDKQKYYEKESGSGGRGRRGSGVASLSNDFGRINTGAFVPNVQAYQSIDQKSGSIPIIRTVRPNIVHKIGSSR